MRSGFSLLEVLLAAALLLGSAVVLGELAGVGARSASAAADLDEAALRCQSKLHEILAGLAPLAAHPPTPLDGDPRWTCAVHVRPVRRGAVELTELRVEVSAPPTRQRKGAAAVLTRWLRPAAVPVEGRENPPPPAEPASEVGP
jgi:Tfp pilus assembly protein PilV